MLYNLNNLDPEKDDFILYNIRELCLLIVPDCWL